MGITEPKYDEDTVNLGYLNKILESLNLSVDKKILTSESNIKSTQLKNYATTPSPPYHEGDTWTTDSIIYRCIKSREIGSFDMSDWVEIYNKKTSDLIKENFLFLSNINLKEQSDGKIETFYQEDDPSINWTTNLLKAEHENDYWRKIGSNGVNSYVYTKVSTNPISYSWVEVDVPMVIFNITKGTKNIYTSRPTSYEIGDLWRLSTTVDAELYNLNINDFVIAIRDSEQFNAAHFTQIDDELTLKTMENYYTVIEELSREIEILNENVDSKLVRKQNEILASVSATYETKETVNSIRTTVQNNSQDIETLEETIEEQVEELAQLSLTQDSINSEVRKKVNAAEIISAINQSAEAIKILANKIKLEGLTTINGAFTVTNDGNVIIGNNVVTMNNQGIQLANGGTILGSNGLLSMFLFTPETDDSVKSMSFAIDTSTGNYVREKVPINIFIPDNFVISKATIHIQHTPIYWDIYDWTTQQTENVWGYDRNVRAYLYENTSDYLEYSYASDNFAKDTSYTITELTNVLAQGGFTAKVPTASTAEIEEITSADIKSYLSTGMNLLVLETGDTSSDLFANMPTNSSAVEESKRICSYRGKNDITVSVIGYYKVLGGNNS